MQNPFRVGALVVVSLLAWGTLRGQETGSGNADEPSAPAVDVNIRLQGQETGSDDADEPGLSSSAEEIVSNARQKADELARRLDESPQARDVSAGILQPIYQLAEAMAFPQFHWVAFTLMAAGTVSYALQLVLGKLVVLTRMSLSIRAILADMLGLAVSLIGLVLTTQAAAENSTFTGSPASVLSATAAGILLGFIFYRWGQTEEVQAALGRRKQASSK